MREKLLHFPCVSRIHSTSERKNPPDFRWEGAKCEYPRILKGMEAELRVGATFRSKLVGEQGAVRNQMIRWLDRYFPEFSQVFPSFGKMALAVLEYTPFPSDLAGKELEEVLALYRQSEGLQSPQRPKAKKLMELAQHSIGVTEGQQMARIEIATLVRRYRQLEEEIEALTEQLIELVQTSVEYEWLKTVPGLGDATIVELLSEIGSFSHYQDPRQLIQLAGLTLREHSSGQHKGRNGSRSGDENGFALSCSGR